MSKSCISHMQTFTSVVVFLFFWSSVGQISCDAISKHCEFSFLGSIAQQRMRWFLGKQIKLERRIWECKVKLSFNPEILIGVTFRGQQSCVQLLPFKSSWTNCLRDQTVSLFIMKINTKQSLSPDFDLKALIYTGSSWRFFFLVTTWLTGVRFILLNRLRLRISKEKPSFLSPVI